MLDMLWKGKTYATVGRHYGFNEIKIHYIKKNKAVIRNTVAVSFCENVKRVMTVRNKHIVRVESTLTLWIIDYKKKNIPLDSNSICEKVQKLYQQFATKDKAEGTEVKQDY